MTRSYSYKLLQMFCLSIKELTLYENMLPKVSDRFMFKFFVGNYEMCGVQRFSDQRAYAFSDKRYCFSGQAMHACQFSVPVWHCQLPLLQVLQI